MEGAYDHIQEETLRPEAEGEPKAEPEGTLSQDLQETYRSFAASPWGARIGGFFGTVRKQGESYIAEAAQEATAAGEGALKGLSGLHTSLVGHARSMSGSGSTLPAPTEGTTTAIPAEAEGEPTSAENKKATTAAATAPNPSSADTEGFVARFRAEAEKRLRDIQKAEDAADEALLRFGTNIRNFLRDAVTVAPPTDGSGTATPGDKVLFESKDSEGRKVIHTSRFDAQLHVIHCALDSFTHDPASPEWPAWKAEFNVDSKTEAIATDLKQYDELRRAMEKLVPQQVDYATFWTRYYFLRLVIESEEQRRKEVLKGAALSTEEEVAWDEDSESDGENARATPQPASSATNLAPPPVEGKEPRTSQDQASTAGSDASYDVVSGATSRAAGSPKEEKTPVRRVDTKADAKAGAKADAKAESDEEDDWE